MMTLIRPNSDDHDGDDDDGGDAPARHTRAAAPIHDDFRTVYAALGNGRRNGTIIGAVATDAEYAPKHFSQIGKIDDIDKRNAWYRAHFTENDGLFEFPDVLRAIPLPPGITEEQLMRLHTLYTVKKDGRTVLGCGKDALEKLDLGYGRTYAPTARNTTFRTLCSVAPAANLTIRGGDVTQAYKNGDWPATMKKVLSHLPMGYNKYEDGIRYVAEVGNLYGHPIAGRNWWKRLLRWMLEHGYSQSEHDPCLFYTTRGEEQFFLIVYVDDILTFTTTGSSLYTEWAEAFTQDFDWTDFGTDLHDFLAIRIQQTADTVTLDMEQYISECVDEFFPGGVHHEYAVPADRDLPNVVYQASLAKDTAYAGTTVGKRFRSLCMKLTSINKRKERVRGGLKQIAESMNYVTRCEKFLVFKLPILEYV